VSEVVRLSVRMQYEQINFRKFLGFFNVVCKKKWLFKDYSRSVSYRYYNSLNVQFQRFGISFHPKWSRWSCDFPQPLVTSCSRASGFLLKNYAHELKNKVPIYILEKLAEYMADNIKIKVLLQVYRGFGDLDGLKRITYHESLYRATNRLKQLKLIDYNRKGKQFLLTSKGFEIARTTDRALAVLKNTAVIGVSTKNSEYEFQKLDKSKVFPLIKETLKTTNKKQSFLIYLPKPEAISQEYKGYGADFKLNYFPVKTNRSLGYPKLILHIPILVQPAGLFGIGQKYSATVSGIEIIFAESDIDSCLDLIDERRIELSAFEYWVKRSIISFGFVERVRERLSSHEMYTCPFHPSFDLFCPPFQMGQDFRVTFKRISKIQGKTIDNHFNRYAEQNSRQRGKR